MKEGDAADAAVIHLGSHKRLLLNAVVESDKSAVRRASVDLTRTANGFTVLRHFLPLANPAWETAKGKHDREHVGECRGRGMMPL